MEGTSNEDTGAFLRDGIKSLDKQGVCPEPMWPYVLDGKAFRTKPPAKCYTAARKRRISSYHRLNTVDEMRACLAEGYPFVFGFTVYQSFESKAVAKTGVLPLPKPDEKTLGGHAVVSVGYNDREKRFLVRNSWAADWGMAGYFTMPYAYLADRNLSDDFWTIRIAAEG